MQLQIVSWNLHEKNSSAKNALAYILGLRPYPDIICLQETPEFILLEIRRNEEYRSYICLDIVSNNHESFLCIMVRVGLKTKEEAFEKHSESENEWLGSQLFGWRWNMCLYSQSVLVETESTSVRVINCHLDVTGSIEKRHDTLAEIVSLHIIDTDEKVILCGDLNTFGCLLRNIFAGWFFGVKLSELFKNEQDMLNTLLKKTGLNRAFSRYTVTHYWSWFSNLDHILYKGLHVFKKGLLPQMHKSDHKGLFVIFTNEEK